MNKRILKNWLLSALFVLSFELRAQIPTEFDSFFQAEQYQEIIDSLNANTHLNFSAGKKEYLLGLSYSRLRKYDLAIPYFKKAIKEGDPSVDLNYEYGQALYANNNLKQARYEFSKSAGKNYNYVASIYYVAYISELLEDLVIAKSNYRKLIRDGRTDKKFLQISLFQYTKILLKMMRKEEESFKRVEKNLIRLEINLVNYIPRYIFPLLRKALDADPVSPVSSEIEQFMRDLLEEFRLDPNTLINGRRISPYRLYANIAQRLKYDDNVGSVSQKASAINETEGFAKYDFVVKKKTIISPELRLTYTKHKDQDSPEVYLNDSFTISTALRNKFEHTYKAQPATFLLDLEYSSIYKDWQASHKTLYYSKSYTVGIGEQISLSHLGETYFKLRRTGYQDESGYANSRTLSLSADQYIFLKEGQHLLIASFDMSKLDYTENPALNTDTYLARFIYLVFEVLPSYTLQTIFAATLTDTKEQRATRGYELNLNPSIDVSKAFTDRIRLGINYNFIQNSSKQTEYRYRRQIIGTELSYTF